MEMLKAMRKCEPGGYVARKAYPDRKYYKDQNGIFMEAAKVDLHRFYLDRLGEPSAGFSQYRTLCPFKKKRARPKGGNGLAR